MTLSKFALAILVTTFSVSAPAAIVINEIYGGGGNTGATYTNDFIELYNNGATTDISSYIVQYVTAAGSFTTPGSNVVTIPASTTLAAGTYYLIGLASGGAVGAALPATNQTGTTNLAANAGNVRLLLSDATTVVDAVGYGSTAVNFEGAFAPGGSTNATSIERVPNGVDSNNNSTDFKVSTPTPGLANVPEPSSAICLLGGIGVLCAFQRSRSSRGTVSR